MVARADRPDFTLPNAHYIPAERWPMGAHVYWRIRVRNLEAGESSDGPVWSFTVAPATAIVDSLFVAPVAYGYWDGVRAVWRCGALLTTATLVAEIVVRTYFESQGKSIYHTRELINLDAPPSRRSAPGPPLKRPCHLRARQW